jgi:hypothetical protein
VYKKRGLVLTQALFYAIFIPDNNHNVRGIMKKLIFACALFLIAPMYATTFDHKIRANDAKKYRASKADTRRFPEHETYQVQDSTSKGFTLPSTGPQVTKEHVDSTIVLALIAVTFYKHRAYYIQEMS